MVMLKRLDPDNLPSQKDEAWKYTNLKRAIPADLDFAGDDARVIHIPCGQNGGKAEDILFIDEPNAYSTPMLKVVVEEGASATLIERHQGSGAYWRDQVSEIIVEKNAILRHIRIVEDSLDSVFTNAVHISVAGGGEYDGFSLITGGKLVRQSVQAVVLGENANLSLNGVTLIKGQQHADNSILIEHLAPQSRSQQFFRNVLDERASAAFQGKVHVAKIAQKTDAQQLCKTLLLSPRAEMNTKPELEIYADDVICAHGATTGQLDAKELFYMRSRGLPKDLAQKLLTRAFLQEAIDKIQDEEIRLTIEEKIEI